MAGKITVAVCSLARSDDEYKHFISVLKEQCEVCVKYVHITSTILENGYDFSQYDGVILIHSVHRGRMSQTNVRDACYDKLLLHWKSLLGRDRVAVIVTGAERTKDREERFKEKQPTVSECSAHVLFCGAGDPINDDHVASTMKSFVGLLPDRPKVRKVQATPSEATTELGEDNSNKETMTIQAKQVKFAGIDVKNGEDKFHVELIICAEGSTRNNLLKTLSEDDLKDEGDFLIFQEKVDDWEQLEAKSITSFDPSSELIHCAVFLFRNEVPPNFTDAALKELEEIVNGRTSPTEVEVSGKADKSCLQQLLKVFPECAYNDHILTVSPGDGTASSLARNQTRREWEHQYEATLKKEARVRIQKINREIRTLRQEQNNIQSDIDGKHKELESVTEDIAKAQHKINEIEKNREQESTRLQEAERGVNQPEKKIEEMIKEFEACTTVLRNAGQEQNQTKNKIEEILKELQGSANVQIEESQTMKKIAELFKELHVSSNVRIEVDKTMEKIVELLKELQTFTNALRETKEKLNRAKVKTEEVLTECQNLCK